jgi:hypothetical protein
MSASSHFFGFPLLLGFQLFVGLSAICPAMPVQDIFGEGYLPKNAPPTRFT